MQHPPRPAPGRVVPLAALWLVVACSSGGGDPPPTLDYGAAATLVRAGEPVTVSPQGAAASGYTVTPALPTGLVLDAATGVVQGTAVATAVVQDYTVRATFAGVELTATLRLGVGAALPTEVTALETGFAIERVVTLLEAPGKFAVAPDGRLFVTERQSGVIRIVHPDGTLEPVPFATVTVTNGNHKGLLGIALSPDFADDGRVFALATVPAGSGKPERSMLWRWVEQAGVGTQSTVLLDDLPVAALDNGGALCFGADGMLFVSIGDVEDPALAQDDGSPAGKVLRIDPADGSAPADNPTPGSRVFVKGLRNTWALAVEPGQGNLFGADNGPAADDELNLLLPGRNFEWGAAPDADFGAGTGPLLRHWPDVVVPTGLAFGAPDAADWPATHRGGLFVALYDEEVVLRFELSGALRTDIDREVEFLRFLPNGVANKPVDLLRGPDGALWLSTFAAVYRIDRIR